MAAKEFEDEKIHSLPSPSSNPAPLVKLIRNASWHDQGCAVP
jgi:hypothetical protein